MMAGICARKKEEKFEVFQKLEEILTLQTLSFYMEGKTHGFWGAIESLDRFLTVKNKICDKV